MKYKDILRLEPGSFADLDIDLVVLNDNLRQETVSRLRKLRVFDASKAVIVVDQIVPPDSPEQSALQRQLMALSDEQGIEIRFGRETTSCFLTGGRLKAGETAAAFNPTVAAAGAAGALGLCVEEDQLVEIFEKGIAPVKVPERRSLRLTGKLPPDCMAMDAALEVIRRLGDDGDGKLLKLWLADGGLFTHMEKASLCILLAQSGAMPVVMEEEELLNGKTGGCESQAEMKEIMLDRLVPQTACKNSYGRIERAGAMDKRSVRVVYNGGSVGGSFENIRLLAETLKGKTLASGVRLHAAPASAEIYRQLADSGYIADILDAGGLVLSQCADPASQCRIGENEVMVSNDWKNRTGYAGYPSSEIIIASTKTAVQSALTGEIGGSRPDDAGEEKRIVLEGRCWKFGDDIDTDIIIPTQWVCMPMEEMRRHAFEPLRPGLADRFTEGDIIVAGDNFGCGSSREMAAEVIAENGIRCIIAKSFARIFFRNAINNGILLVECPDLPDEAKEGDLVRVELNRQITCRGKTYPVGRIPENLWEIIADGGLVNNIEKKVKRGLL